MKPRRRWLKWLKWLAIVIGCWVIVIPSLQALWLRHRVVSAFEAARLVCLEEFLPSELSGPVSKGKVLNSVELSAEQRKALVSAIPMTPDIGVPGSILLCYMPHHRVVMTNPDGGQVAFEICFGCDEFSFAQDPVVMTPFLWRSSLRGLFTDHGIPVRTKDEYRKLQFPEYEH
jgi:hypothetical protein